MIGPRRIMPATVMSLLSLQFINAKRLECSGRGCFGVPARRYPAAVLKNVAVITDFLRFWEVFNDFPFSCVNICDFQINALKV